LIAGFNAVDSFCVGFVDQPNAKTALAKRSFALVFANAVFALFCRRTVLRWVLPSHILRRLVDNLCAGIGCKCECAYLLGCVLHMWGANVLCECAQESEAVASELFNMDKEVDIKQLQDEAFHKRSPSSLQPPSPYMSLALCCCSALWLRSLVTMCVCACARSLSHAHTHTQTHTHVQVYLCVGA
jgi:ABC-type Fe3+/spermidine/putrescine transport system ATPase subunit